jgi:HSP20 family protein
MYNRRSYAVLPRTFTGLMEDIMNNGWNKPADDNSSYAAPVNIKETGSSYELHVVAPGLKKEDFKLNIEKNTLHISYEHKEKEQNQGEQNDEKWLRSEFKTRSFKRSFNLNEKVDADKISARYEDGVLYITLPKKEVSEPAVHEIHVN